MSDEKNTNDTEKGNARDGGYEEVCSICRRPESKAGRMLHLPANLCVCNDCLQKAINAAPMIQQMMPGMTEWPMQGEEAEPEPKEEKTSVAETEILEAGSAENTEETAADGSEEEETEESGKDAGQNMQGFPRIDFRMIDLSQFGSWGGMEIPQRQKVKKKKGKSTPDFTMKDVSAPHKIKAMLDEYVVGQEQAKKTISVAVYNHYKRILADDKDGVEIEKSNMLLIGPTGSGKTYLVKTLAKLLDVPLAIADATSLTEAGYIGDDIESVLSKLLAAADNDVEKAEHGIVFIDEIDKIAKKRNSNTRDVSGESVQQELLKMLEGSQVEVPVGAGSKNGMVPMATVDTRNILFICGGAFPDLNEVIRERLNQRSSIGFQADLKDRYDEEKDLLSQVQVEDLRKFGMIPEFLGRLPILVALKPLTKEFLIRILKEPRNAILKQYQKLLAMDEVELVFDDGALEVIAEKAMEKDTGARALRAILEEYMLDIMYEIPKDSNIGRVTITREYLKNTGGPIIELRGQFVPGQVPLLETR
ncbi:MAG: ATP-dependent Clp protease ATP-binding subunit ClpX [Lachnospiraceae bacterium]|nr:ATP-dependent Clp protease ATP-binding subunit ClpX [Lachnospiraceae bacterium]